MHSRNATRSIGALGVAVALVLLVVGERGFAQEGGVRTIGGRGFSGINLPQPIERYELSFGAVRGRVWREAGSSRIYLQRDVVVEIGLFTFEAETAVVWLELIEVEGREAMQVAAYFTEVVSPMAGNGIAQESETLLVTAVTYDVQTTLRVDEILEGRPTGGEALERVRAGEARFARHLAGIAGVEADVDAARKGARDGGDVRGGVVTREGEFVRRRESRAEAVERPAWMDFDPRDEVPRTGEDVGEIISADGGTVTFDGTDISYRAAREDGTGPMVLLEGGFAIQYRAPDRAQAVILTADSAVVFLSGSAEPGAGRYDVGDVQGVYLEGGVRVEAEGQTLNANRVYFDIEAERGVIIDGVFRLRDEGLGVPITFRAQTIRQLSMDQWSARDVELANVSFAEPHFAIGATDITITRRREGGRSRTFVDAEGVSFNVGKTPVLTLPRLRGEAKASPIRKVEAGQDGGTPVVRTEWDLYALLGVEGPEETEASFLLDGYLERGVGTGVDFAWDTLDFTGALFAYYAYTDGEDELTSGADLEPVREHRGMVLGENVYRLNERWTLFAEASYISDAAFVDALFENLAEERREFTNSIRAKYDDGASVFSIEARGSVNDFVANEYLLQSLGYNTERLPEARYTRLSDNLFGDLVSYSSDTRAGLVSANFNEVTAREQGFNTARRARAAFGLLPTQSIADRLRASNFTKDEVARFDTRHEIEIPLRAGPVNVTPFAVGRLTAYDDDFDAFAGQDNDDYRLWGSAGVRLGTSLQRVYPGFSNKTLGAEGLRHIVEPEATLWHASTNLRQGNLPIYDDGVESIAEGTSANVAVTNTFQTKRGRAGDRRSVDWIVTRSSFTWSSDEVDGESPFGRFFSYRPEHSNLGEYFRNETVWNVTDAVALTNDILIDTDEGRVASNAIGAEVAHGPFLTTFAEYRELDPLDAAFLRVGGRHELTTKYAVGLAGTYDFDDSRFQSVSAFVTRRFPQWTMDVAVDVDEITDSLGLSVSLRPVGFGGERRLRAFGAGLEPTETIGTLRGGRGRVDRGPFGE